MSKKLVVEQSVLSGKVYLSGAKNSALKLQTATLLCDEEITLENFPNGLSDVKIQSEMLRELGKSVKEIDNKLIVSGDISDNNLIWNDRSIRNSLLILGALVAKTGYGKVPLPGGCKIGERKYDLHIMILENMGAKVWEEEGYLIAEAENGLKSTELTLPFRSTGATENAIILGCLTNGVTRLWNPHVRPEVLELITFLNQQGTDIIVNGNESITINGVQKLKGINFSVMPDNMEALTYLIAGAVTGGEIEIVNFPFKDLEVPMIFLQEAGINVYKSNTGLISKNNRFFPLEISTGSYPGINSDMQPLMALVAAHSQGISKIVDLRFPNRYSYAQQLNKMGLESEVSENQLVIYGGNELNGAEVYADDLRAGAALLIAGLSAKGKTVIENASQIERGYENFLEKFQSLGAKVYWSNKDVE